MSAATPGPLTPSTRGAVVPGDGRDGDGRATLAPARSNSDPVAGDRPPALRLGAGSWRALRHYNYRLYFAGQVISQSGTWLQRIAQSWLVLDLTNSPAALGVLTVFQFLPAMLLSLVAGVVADRVGKRRLIMVTSTLEGVQALVLAALVLTGTIQLWEVDGLALLLGIFTTFETPARQAFVSDLVPREDLQSAIALNSSVFNAARIVGPGLGGVIIALWGTGWAFLLNGVSYVAVVIALAVLRVDLLVPGRLAGRGALWSQVRDGLRHARHNPRLAFPLALLAVVGMLGYNFGVTLPLLARYTLGIGVAGFGSLNAAMGAGSLAGALFVTPFIPPRLRTVALGALGFSVLLILMALIPWYVGMLAALVTLGVVSVAYSTTTNTTLQLESGEDYRGRILSLYSLLFMGTTPIGGGITGLLADTWGVEATLVAEGGVCLLAALIGLLYLRRLASQRVAESRPSASA